MWPFAQLEKPYYNLKVIFIFLVSRNLILGSLQDVT